MRDTAGDTVSGVRADLPAVLCMTQVRPLRVVPMVEQSGDPSIPQEQ